MVLVRTRFQGGVDHPANGPAEFGGKTAGLNLELLYGVEIGLSEDLATARSRDRRAVDHKLTRPGSATADTGLSVAGCRRRWAGARAFLNTGRQSYQVKRIPAAKRKLLDGLLVDDLAQCRLLGLQQ